MTACSDEDRVVPYQPGRGIPPTDEQAEEYVVGTMLRDGYYEHWLDSEATRKARYWRMPFVDCRYWVQYTNEHRSFAKCILIPFKLNGEDGCVRFVSSSKSTRVLKSMSAGLAYQVLPFWAHFEAWHIPGGSILATTMPEVARVFGDARRLRLVGGECLLTLDGWGDCVFVCVGCFCLQCAGYWAVDCFGPRCCAVCLRV